MVHVVGHNEEVIAAVCFTLFSLAAADLTREELLGRFDPASHPGFVKVAGGYYLRRETAEAFAKMSAAAARDQVKLNIVSATRNFAAQKAIWERKWNALAGSPEERARQILRFSSMPGTSRHHWGTDIDLNRLQTAWFRTGEGLRLYEWLRQHAPAYGFCQPYQAKGPARPHGYEEEPWHWSYQPLSGEYLKQYLAKMKPADLTGFTGSQTSAAVGAIDHYVAGVAAECR